MLVFARAATASALLLCGTAALAQSYVPLNHQVPDGVILTFQLTDGTVLAQGGNENDWWRLTPDKKGSYVNGTWAQMATLPSGYIPYAFSSAVLANGLLVVAGGEYNDNNFAFTKMSTVYDPVKNTWTKLKAPQGWNFIGDSPSSVLADGTYLLGQKFTERLAALDPATLTWKAAGNRNKADFNAEEGWTLLPSGQVLTADVKDYGNAELYTPKTGVWTQLGSTENVLAGPPQSGPIHYGKNKTYYPPGEIGPAILRPDGTVFATGAVPRNGSSGLTAIYTPGANGAAGTWSKGPAFPNGDDAGDNFAALLPNGNVIVEGNSGRFYEWNGTSLAQSALNQSGGALMMLPSGELFVGGTGVYRPAGQPNPAWAPAITNAPSTLTRGTTVTLTGTQFNGLSQAASFGDEFQTATNYPIARLEYGNGTVIYGRTHDHSSMGVATGSTPVTTEFDVPAAAPAGGANLVVIANGIPSQPVGVTVK